MDENEMVFALMTMALIAGTIIALVRMFLNRGSTRPAANIEPAMDRLVRIEQTLDAVAIEVERISEAQRFATRLLADRDTAPALAESRGSRDLR